MTWGSKKTTCKENYGGLRMSPCQWLISPWHSQIADKNTNKKTLHIWLTFIEESYTWNYFTYFEILKMGPCLIELALTPNLGLKSRIYRVYGKNSFETESTFQDSKNKLIHNWNRWVIYAIYTYTLNLGCELLHKKCSILKIELYKAETDK